MSLFKIPLTQLYIGYFGRAPEPEGLQFWEMALEEGFGLAAAANDFAAQPETLTLYPYLASPNTNDVETFLDAVYQNLFGRTTDAAGLTFWSAKIDAGLPLGTAILNIIEGAAPDDVAVLENKVDLACQWHDLAAIEPGFALTPAAIASSRDALAEVTSEASSIAPDSVARGIVEAFFNDAPVLSVVPVLNTLAEDADTSQRLKVADITLTDDGLGDNQLSLTGADANLFEISGNEVFLKAGAALDFEMADRLEVSVIVDDPVTSNSPDGSALIQIDINDVNEAPSLTLAPLLGTLAENADTTNRIKVADITVADDALGTNLVSLEGTDAALFELDAGGLFLRAGTALDFASNPQLDVTVTLDDETLSAGNEDSAAISIAISDVNAAPTVSIVPLLSTFSEATDTIQRIKVADAVISDDALGSNSLSLSGENAALFELDGTELFLRAGTALDFETDAELEVVIAVDDADVGGAPDDTAQLTIALTDVNEPPQVSTTLLASSLDENADTSARIKVADIAISDDVAVSGPLSVTLSGADAALFEVDGDTLYLKAGTVLNFESTPNLNVTIEVDDPTLGSGFDAQEMLSIAIVDINEPPAITVTPVVTSLAEDTDTTSRRKVADVTVTDDGVGNNALGLSGANAGQFEIDGTEIFLRANAALDFESAATLEVVVTVDDADVGLSPDGTAVLSIAVTDVNEAPVVTLTTLASSISEDADTAGAIRLVDIDVTDDALGSVTIALSGSDAALFEVIDAALFLRAGTALDFEAQSQLDVTIIADDLALGTGPEFSADLRFDIEDVNEAPFLTVTNIMTELAEDTDVTNRIKIAELTIGDDALGDNMIELSGDNAHQLELDGTALFLRAGATLDFETVPTLNVTLSLDDPTVGDNPDDTADITLNITDVPEAPIAVDDQITTSEFLVNALTQGQQDDAAVAALSDGRIIAAWRSTDSQQGFEAGTGVKARIFNTDGSEAVPEFPVNNLIDGSQQIVGIAPLSDGGFAITWRSSIPVQGDADGYGVKARVFDANGAPKAGEFLVNTLTSGDQSTEQITSLSGGGFVITWRSDDPQQGDTDGPGIKARIFDDTGQQVTAEFLVNNLAAGGQFDPDIAALSGGGFVVAWRSDDPQQGDDKSSGVKARIFDADGDAQGAEFLVNDLTNGGQGLPVLAPVMTGGFVAVWQSSQPGQGDASGSGIKARYFDADGNETVGEFLVNAFASSSQSNPDVATLPNGNVVVTWQSQDQEQSDRSGSGIKARIFDVAGQEIVPEFVVNALTSDSQACPAISALNDGGFVISWDSQNPQQGDDSDNGVKARAFDADGTARDVVRLLASDDTADFDAGALLQNDVDPDGDVLTVTTIAAQSEHGAALVLSNGSITYDPSGSAAIQALSFEQSLIDSFTYTIIDSDGLTAQATATLIVLGANKPPSLTVTQDLFDIDENTPVTSPLKVADLEIFDDGAGNNDLTLSGADASLFSIEGLELFLDAGTILDFETDPELDVTVSLNDTNVGTDPDDIASLSIAVNNLNEAPTLALSNLLSSLPEDTGLATRFKVADVSVTDDSLGTNTVSLSGADVALFELDGSELFLQAGAVLDFDTNAVLDVTVTVDDGQGGIDSDALVIDVHPDLGFEIQSNTGINGERLGHSVAFIGDLNQDGLSDILIGAPRHSAAASNMGGAYVIYGSTTPFPNTVISADIPGNHGFLFEGNPFVNGQAGYTVSAVGDLNGDTIADLAVGAWAADPGGNNVAGETHILFGSTTTFSGTIGANTLNGTNGFTIQGADAIDRSGWSIAALGDINNDGFDDILIGAPRAEPVTPTDVGESYVIFGKNTGFAASLSVGTMTAAEGFTMVGLAGFDESGSAVGSAGDINSDGIQDFVVSAPFRDVSGVNTNDGEVYVVFGGNANFGTSTTFDLSTLNGTNGFAIQGAAASDRFATSIASVGDINGDTYDDLLIGAEFAGTGGIPGASYVIYGIPNTSSFAASMNVSALNGTNGFLMNGLTGGDENGVSVSSAGDINGDGINDMLISAPGGDPNGLTNSGETYLVFGKSSSGFGASFDLSTLDGTEGYILNGLDGFGESGFSVSGGGDFNGDMVDDLLIGAHRTNSGAGESYLLHGGANHLAFFDAADGTVDGQIQLVGLQQMPEFV